MRKTNNNPEHPPTLKLSISRLKVYAYHGVLPQEQTVGANFYLTIQAEVDADDAALRDDDLRGTVSYAEVIASATEEMQIRSRLLENVVFRIARRLLADFPRIAEVTVSLEKENPPLRAHAESIGVGLTLTR